MSRTDLTLPEKKLLLDTEVSGLQLIEYALLDLIAGKALSFIPSKRKGDKNGFLVADLSHSLYRQSSYHCILTVFELTPRVQVSRCLKALMSHFDGDFNNFKKKYLLPSLEDRWHFIRFRLFGYFSSEFDLTEKGEQYKKRLLGRLKSIHDLKHDADGRSSMDLLEMDSEVFLLGNAFIAQLERSRKDDSPNVFSNIDELLELVNLAEDFLWELNTDFLESSIDILDFTLPSLDFLDFGI